jgi:hypothetical protein
MSRESIKSRIDWLMMRRGMSAELARLEAEWENWLLDSITEARSLLTEAMNEAVQRDCPEVSEFLVEEGIPVLERFIASCDDKLMKRKLAWAKEAGAKD